MTFRRILQCATRFDHVFAFHAAVAAGVLTLAAFTMPAASAQSRHNVIIFVADGLRRGSVDAETMPSFWKIRTSGVDFQNSHSVFPTFTTANASAIATGHGLGDTGDYSNTLYPGTWLARPDGLDTGGFLTPFIENDAVLANLNGAFGGNYLGERTLLSLAQEKGFNVASVGKLGPTAIQQIEGVGYDAFGLLSAGAGVIVDDASGLANGLPLPTDLREAMDAADLSLEAPSRTNGYGEFSQWNNAFVGDAKTPGTRVANITQQQWFANVTTKVLLPKFAAEQKPFVLLFWSRDPDGTQHNQGDSLQQLTPGINGDTSRQGLRNADRCLRQLLDWLDAHPAVKANTDVILTSDHGFATISRRELAADGTSTGAVSSALEYEATARDPAQIRGTLPSGFLAVDLAVRGHLRLYDSSVRSSGGPSVFAELALGGERSQHPSQGSALLGDAIKSADGSDARLIVAANGGSDLIYVPSGSPAVVHETLALLSQLDYVGGLFVDDKYCGPTVGGKDAKCGGALRLSAIGLVGASKVPRPAIVVTYKVFYQRPGDLQSAVQIADTGLQEGQGQHGGFGRDQTFNNMAAMGPDFRKGFQDELPMGNIDLAPTLAKVLGLTMPTNGKLTGRVLEEALTDGSTATAEGGKTLVSAPGADGRRTVLEYQESHGVRYYDRACFVAKDAPANCR